MGYDVQRKALSPTGRAEPIGGHRGVQLLQLRPSSAGDSGNGSFLHKWVQQGGSTVPQYVTASRVDCGTTWLSLHNPVTNTKQDTVQSTEVTLLNQPPCDPAKMLGKKLQYGKRVVEGGGLSTNGGQIVVRVFDQKTGQHDDVLPAQLRLIEGQLKASNPKDKPSMGAMSHWAQFFDLPKDMAWRKLINAGQFEEGKTSKEARFKPTGNLMTWQGADYYELQQDGGGLKAWFLKKAVWRHSDVEQKSQAFIKKSGPLVNRWSILKDYGKVRVTDVDGKNPRTISARHRFWSSGIDTHSEQLVVSKIQDSTGAMQTGVWKANGLERFVPQRSPADIVATTWPKLLPYERWTLHTALGTPKASWPNGRPTWGELKNKKAVAALGFTKADWDLAGRKGMGIGGGAGKKASKLVKDLGTVKRLSDVGSMASDFMKGLMTNDAKLVVELRVNVPIPSLQAKFAGVHVMLASIIELEKAGAAIKSKSTLQLGLLGKVDAGVLKAFVKAYGELFVEAQGDNMAEVNSLIWLGVRQRLDAAGAWDWLKNAVMTDAQRKTVAAGMDDDDYAATGGGFAVAGGLRLKNPDGTNKATADLSTKDMWSHKTTRKGGKLVTNKSKTRTQIVKASLDDWGGEFKQVLVQDPKSGAYNLKEWEIGIERGLDIQGGDAKTVAAAIAGGGLAAAALLKQSKHGGAAAFAAVIAAGKFRGVGQAAVGKIQTALDKLGKVASFEMAVKCVFKYTAGGELEIAILNVKSLKVSYDGTKLKRGGKSSKNDILYAGIELEHVLAKTTVKVFKDVKDKKKKAA